jgi:hypothetical protein
MMRPALSLAFLLSIPTRTAIACPFCDQRTAQAVSTAIFNERFAQHLALMATPFLLFGAIVAWVYFGGTEHGSK